jgi:ferredoxin
MNSKEFAKLITYLFKNYRVCSTQEENNQISINELSDPKEVALSNRLPFYSWKKFFVPEKEILFKTNNGHLKPLEKNGEKIALFGINSVDLQAVLLYDKVFANDQYYQARMENTLIIGYSLETKMPDKSIRKLNEKSLENLRFDIFIDGDKKKITQVYAGSNPGIEILDKIGCKKYKKIEFQGHRYSKEWENKMNSRRDSLKNRHNPKIWDELGKICLECGKCTIACPTCFCFRIDDSSESRERCWDSCYYSEFSEVAGGHKFLNNTASRIHFWYNHKFARIPDEYGMMGCIGCGRCHEACPVGIDIKKVMEDVEKS